ncbi:hypothetical protein Cgig2_029616 [Carnegiea gigantea]|uniref:Uncharacterized protein n=1 Tax=Carnegiea gigantea TaxID=171969 RepID=A0A9Q1KG91_9CARY|nr:hypothetical protein Cgig2_029616 [Carnegiea gigantea]
MWYDDCKKHKCCYLGEAFAVNAGLLCCQRLVAGNLPRSSGVVFPDLLVSLWFLSFLRRPLQRPEVSVAAGGVFTPETYRQRLFRSPESRQSFIFCVFHVRSGRLKCSRARFVRFSFSVVAGRGFYLLVVTHSMRGGCKRFVAIESKSFNLTIVGTVEDVLKISENGRGRSTSVLLPENVALWLLRALGTFYKSKSSNWGNQVHQGSSIFLLESKRKRAEKFLQLSIINKGKKTFVIFPADWNERSWAKIFDALNEIQRVITELGMRASRSVSTHVYSRRNSFRNRRNRLRDSNGCNSEGSVCTNWPLDALLVYDTSSPSTDKAKCVDPALYKAKICGQAASNTFVPLARDVVVSHQVHMGSLDLQTRANDPMKIRFFRQSTAQYFLEKIEAFRSVDRVP